MLRPQKGPQENFLATSADIAIYGGSAGGGKSYALLLEVLRHKNVPGFNAVIFRKKYIQITAPGGLWETSLAMYSGIRGAVPTASPKKNWSFGKKARLSFDYISRDDDVLAWQGSQICLIGFDELTHFSEYQFFYMFSRNRSICGVSPYIRATCNPDADSWVADFISWWIDQDTGYPIIERSGKLRWFFRKDEQIVWGDSIEELSKKFAGYPEFQTDLCKSVTFIASSIYDNKILLDTNPGYLASLYGLSVVEKERLLSGNWKIRPAAGLYFKREQATVVRAVPGKIIVACRAWDLAATEITAKNKNPDRTAGVLLGRLQGGRYIILDVKRCAANAADVRRLVKSTAANDYAIYGANKISIPQDPGQAGKEQAQSYVKELAGFAVKTKTVTGSKETRAEPFAAQWQAGNVLLLDGDWNEEFLTEMEGFPDAVHDDQVDAASDAFAMLSNTGVYSAPPDTETKESYWNL